MLMTRFESITMLNCLIKIDNRQRGTIKTGQVFAAGLHEIVRPCLPRSNGSNSRLTVYWVEVILKLIFYFMEPLIHRIYIRTAQSDDHQTFP